MESAESSLCFTMTAQAGVDMNTISQKLLFVDYPVKVTFDKPHITVICLPDNPQAGGALTLTRSDAFKMGLAGMIDLGTSSAEIQRELKATTALVECPGYLTGDNAQSELMLAHKYLMRALESRDFDCIYTVVKSLMTKAEVMCKRAIFRELNDVCCQIEYFQSCSIRDMERTLFDLQSHVFRDALSSISRQPQIHCQ